MEKIPIVIYKDGEREVIGEGELKLEEGSLIVHAKIEKDSNLIRKVVGEYSINDVAFTEKFYAIEEPAVPPVHFLAFENDPFDED